jgi:hypothetical protein
MSDHNEHKIQSTSSFLPYSEENITDYSIKVIEYLCKRYKKATEIVQSTDFDIDEVWSEDLKAIIGDNSTDNFRAFLTTIQKTGYLEIQGNAVHLTEGKTTICAEVGIVLD